ncbi:HAD-like domain-containing protein [Biscogniauxia sp. FL1348]|nr:HAD-like domain-containing protein [Biscogniauxia sp. FL1348]
MAKLTDFDVLSFDVYGTLIDWETGIVTSLQPLLDSNNASFSREKLLDVVHECERTQQAATPTLLYHELLRTIHPQIADKLGLPEPSPDQSEAFGASVGSWPAFPDTVDALKRLGKHYKLVIISNVDLVSFAKSNEGPLAGVKFDMIVTAQDVGSYKPDLRNFQYMVKKVQEEFGVPKERILQTAQSQFHDHHPAKAMGMYSSWIVRPGAIMGNRDSPVYDWKFDTLGEMADALEEELRR